MINWCSIFLIPQKKKQVVKQIVSIIVIIIDWGVKLKLFTHRNCLQEVECYSWFIPGCFSGNYSPNKDKIVFTFKQVFKRKIEAIFSSLTFIKGYNKSVAWCLWMCWQCSLITAVKTVMQFDATHTVKITSFRVLSGILILYCPQVALDSSPSPPD